MDFKIGEHSVNYGVFLYLFPILFSIFGNFTVNMVIQHIAAMASAIASPAYTPETPMNIGNISESGIRRKTFLRSAINSDVPA